jgi:hypothetical protein
MEKNRQVTLARQRAAGDVEPGESRETGHFPAVLPHLESAGRIRDECAPDRPEQTPRPPARGGRKISAARFTGLLPRGAAVHVIGDDAGLSLTSLTGAEIDLSARLQRPVGIVLKSELKGREQVEVLGGTQPL